ncbi:hypothetical protein LCGC14_0782030 [marine sediment metagenome]|uniref:Uncharacterized protein n=1 Tax=marine sediment metagenome TaxID=412755 RepID=A0A0F9T291_9ZZZZ
MAGKGDTLQVIGEGPEQLFPDEAQLTDSERQLPAQAGEPPPLIAESDKRTLPIPDTGVVVQHKNLPEVTPEMVAQAEAIQTLKLLQGWPVAKINRYTGTQAKWQTLVTWKIDSGRIGNLHEISLVSSDDSKTRYRIIIANVDQKVPVDRQTTSPFNLTFRENVIPTGSEVYVQVRSTDETSITVDGIITGTES